MYSEFVHLPWKLLLIMHSLTGSDSTIVLLFNFVCFRRVCPICQFDSDAFFQQFAQHIKSGALYLEM